MELATPLSEADYASSDSSQLSEYASTVQVGVDATAAYERGKTDINFFAGLAMPDVMVSPLPYFYVVCFWLLVRRPANQIGKILRFALGLPRGHAKTTFIKIIIAWLIAYDKKRFIVVACATEDNSQNILEDIHTIMGSPNMEAVYGAWTAGKIVDNKETKKFHYHNRIVILEAKGAQSAVRGLNKNFERPDCILCDDLQTRENDESLTDSKKLKRWLTATLLKTIDTKGDRLIIYIGNMYSENCILRMLQRSPSWISLVTGAILEDGTPLWPELHSLESLMESYLHDESLGEADVWFSEVMNDPRNLATSLLKQSLPQCPFSDIVADGVFITIDPAGYRSTSDDNVIVVHKVYDGKGFIAKTDAGKYNPQELIRLALQRAIEYGASVIGIETVAYQQTLKFWMEFYVKELGLTGIEVVELKPHGRSKESRIRAFIAELLDENYYHENSDERALFTYQAMAYKIGAKQNKDDLLDAQAYGLDIRRDFWHLIKNNLTIASEFMRKARVISNNTPF